MSLSDQIEIAQANLRTLSLNPYPGRGIVIGLNPSGKFIIMIYWIMGRSDNSRNRLFEYDETGRLFTVAADASKMKDPSLVIYNAMIEQRGLYVVSNGDQTDSVVQEDLARSGLRLSEMIRHREYEPDKPNNTIRITGLVNKRLTDWADSKPRAELLILQKSLWSDACERRSYDLELAPGVGWCITTYAGDGEPLPSFRGDPYLLPINDIEKTLSAYWDNLNADNRVALAVKAINAQTGKSMILIKNRYTKVAA